jgi:DNA-binding transcriptional LysR family regulator
MIQNSLDFRREMLRSIDAGGGFSGEPMSGKLTRTLSVAVVALLLSAGAARLFYASPSYLVRRGAPAEPSDLSTHDCILQSYMARPNVWRLISADTAVDVEVRGRVSTNNVSMTLRLAEQGYGIAALSPAIARPAHEAGAVRRVLDGWSLPPMPVHAVMTSRLMPARVRLFVDFLVSRLTI